MRVFFDNCTAPVLATTLHGFISNEGHFACHIRDMPGLPKGRHSADVEWIELLRQAPEQWMFVSGDKRLLRNPAERAALRRAGLHGFVLAPGLQKMAMNYCAGLLVQRWPDLLQITRILSPPSMHEIPVRTTKLRSLPL